MKIKAVVLKDFNEHKEGDKIELKKHTFISLELRGYVKEAPKFKKKVKKDKED